MTHKYSSVSGMEPILSNLEQPAFEVLNPHGSAPVVLTCDHASNQVPESLQKLGLPDEVFSQHIAYDIGCSALSEQMSEMFDAVLVRSCFSRLVVDPNRHLNDPSSIPEVSDGVTVPGNLNLSRQQAGQRVEELFVPYHNAVAATMADCQARHGVPPVLIAVHSFTPVFQGFQRPWHIGVLWNRDGRVAVPLIERLRQREQLCVGDNEPYHAREPVGYTMDVHAEGTGFPHLLLEVRQDLISTDDGVAHWAKLLYEDISVVIEDPDIYHVMEYEND